MADETHLSGQQIDEVLALMEGFSGDGKPYLPPRLSQEDVRGICLVIAALIASSVNREAILNAMQHVIGDNTPWLKGIVPSVRRLEQISRRDRDH